MASYNNILVAVDFSPAAQHVLEKACAMARLNDAPLHLLHVVEFLPPVETTYAPTTSPEWLLNEEALVKSAEQRMAEVSCGSSPETVTREVVIGTPKHEIVRVAAERDIDLIVMGSHGRHGFARLLGSTASPVLHNAPCDVLAIRIRDQ